MFKLKCLGLLFVLKNLISGQSHFFHGYVALHCLCNLFSLPCLSPYLPRFLFVSSLSLGSAAYLYPAPTEDLAVLHTSCTIPAQNPNFVLAVIIATSKEHKPWRVQEAHCVWELYINLEICVFACMMCWDYDQKESLLCQCLTLKVIKWLWVSHSFSIQFIF